MELITLSAGERESTFIIASNHEGGRSLPPPSRRPTSPRSLRKKKKTIHVSRESLSQCHDSCYSLSSVVGILKSACTKQPYIRRYAKHEEKLKIWGLYDNVVKARLYHNARIHICTHCLKYFSRHSAFNRLEFSILARKRLPK